MARPKLEYGIKDIAKKCGVSPATVSRVFNQHPNVRETIREKVFSVARKMNYKLQHSASGKVIAIALPDFSSQPFGVYHTSIIPLLVKEIHDHGYDVVMVPINDLEQIRRYFISATIAVAFRDEIIHNWENHFSMPLVVINSPGRKLENAIAVNSDEEQGMRMAVKYLAANGHRRIGLVVDGNVEMNVTKRRRYIGYMKALKETHCVMDKNLVQMSAPENRMENMGRIFRNGATAMICSGESSGLYVDYVMNLFKKKIPGEMSIITFENSDVSSYCSPPHTTLCQNFAQLASEAVKMAVQAIDNPPMAHDVMVDYTLIERESVDKIESLPCQ